MAAAISSTTSLEPSLRQTVPAEPRLASASPSPHAGVQMRRLGGKDNSSAASSAILPPLPQLP